MKRLILAAFATALCLSPANAAFDAGDIICETSTTTGTGTLNLAGAVTNYATFVSQITSGSSVNYHITASDGKLETGVGVLTDASPDTLTRVAYWSSDGSGAELTLPAGTHTVCLGPTTQMFAGMKGIQLYTDDAGAVGGVLPFWHDSASAADGDIAADIQVFAGDDDEEVGSISLEVDDGATGAEDTQWKFVNRLDGTDISSLTLNTVGFALAAHVLDWGTSDAPVFIVQNSSSSSGGPIQVFYQNSTTPAASDAIGTIQFRGEDSAAGEPVYARIAAGIVSPTDGAEYGALSLRVLANGANSDALALGNTGFIRFHEASANGANFKAITAAAAFTADTTCTLENDANFIPMSCVDDGTDNTSDARLKENVRPADPDAVSKIIDDVKIYDFEWNQDLPGVAAKIKKGAHGFGPLAQEIYEVDPLLARPGGDDPTKEPWRFNGEQMVPYLVVETQSLRKRVRALEDRLPTCYGIKFGSACLGVSM